MENLNENVMQDVLFVVLLNNNQNFNTKAPYDLEIMGKKMWEWVALSGSGAEVKTIPCTDETNVISLVKTYLTAKPITMVFYSDTPRLTKGTVLEILDYFKSKNLNVLKLKRGFVFNSEYLATCESILSEESGAFTGKEFDAVSNFKDLAEVLQEFKKSIINYHRKNGVYIVDENSTFIDADVIIENNVTIWPNNIIKGKTYIAEGVVLEANNVLKNSVICRNAVIKNSYVSEGSVKENSIVGPYETIIDKNM